MFYSAMMINLATEFIYLISLKRRIILQMAGDTALRFGKFFGNSAAFWLGIQMEYDLRKEEAAAIECVLEEIDEFK